MRKWKGWWIPTPVTGKEKDSWGCYATEQTEKCSEIQCQDCIYWNLDGQAEWRLKEYLKKHKQGKEQVRDSKGRFCKKEETESYLWEGLKVPVDPKREWGEWMCSNVPCPGFRGGVGCKHVCDCVDCIYAWRHADERRCFYEQWYGKYPISNNNELPKLTAEIFKRSDCPEWAKWAAVDKDGEAAYYEQKPILLSEIWRWPGTHASNNRWQYALGGKCFDASDWEHSLVERELPKLTQTAFHCPDCPKGATKLKVFPANHVVALDKDDKVLSVMELQCKEGEVSKSEWFYSHGTLKLYQKNDYRCDIPKDAVPVRVHYPSPNQLIGKAVANDKTGKNYLVAEVNGLTVTLQGVDKKELLSMPTLLQFYSFVDGGDLCCSFETLP